MREGVSDDAVAVDVEVLFRSQYRHLVGLAELLVDDRAVAEGIVQGAFAELYCRRRRIQEPAAWLRTAVVKASRSRMRRRGGPPPDNADGADSGDDRADRWAVAAALRALPARQRACAALRAYDGLTRAETAAVLGLSDRAARTHSERGVAALAAAVGAAGEGAAPDEVPARVQVALRAVARRGPTPDELGAWLEIRRRAGADRRRRRNRLLAVAAALAAGVVVAVVVLVGTA